MCLQFLRCNLCKRAMRISKESAKGCLHTVKENFNTSIYRKCVENNLVSRAKVMATHSLKFGNYSVRVENNALLAISDQFYVSKDGVRLLPCFRYRRKLRVQTALRCRESSLVSLRSALFFYPAHLCGFSSRFLVFYLFILFILFIYIYLFFHKAELLYFKNMLNFLLSF